MTDLPTIQQIYYIDLVIFCKRGIVIYKFSNDRMFETGLFFKNLDIHKLKKITSRP